jgi:16S rRNA (uracil1498-N3)-methyltransferase
MHRFYIAPPLRGGDVALPERVARQVVRVLRMRPGDPLVLFDGTGGEWEAELATADSRDAAARLVRHRTPEVEPALRLTLCQSLLKADKLEWVLQKGTELGVARFVLMVSQRVVAAERERAASRRHSDAPAGKLDRWQRIVVEAAEQSGRTQVPAIEPPLPLRAVLAGSEPGVLCWEEERERTFLDALRGAAAGGRVRVFVGPEGGFAPAEAAAARAAGLTLASLGPRTLRSETAAVAAAALALLALS